jgi:fibronectin-binding autotransporter adhesin
MINSLQPTAQKSRLRHNQLRRGASCLVAALLVLFVAASADAATINKANNTNNLNLTTSWTGGVVPGSGDIALWNSTVTGANTVSLGANLNFGELQITNPGGLVTINTGNTLTLSGVAGVGIDMSTATQNLTLNPSISLGASQIWNVGTSRTLTIGGTISGSGNTITKNGAGTLTMNADNLFNNVGLTMNAGLMLLTTNNNQVRTFSLANLSGSGGTIQVNGNNSTVTLSVGSDNTSTSYGGTFNENGNVNTQLTLTKVGTGTLTLTGSNSYTGGTNVNAGVLNVGSVNAIGSSGTISFGGGTLQYSASNTTDYSARFSAAANQAYSVDTNGQSVTYATALTSSGGSLTKSGSGTLTLTGASTYSGATTINAGTLKLDNNNTTTARLANTSNITLNSGGTLLLAQTGVASTDRINNAATMTLAGGTFNTGGLSERGGTLAAPTAGIGALTLTANSTIDFGAGTTSIIEFAGLGTHTAATLLQIINWDGIPATGNGTERLLFAGNVSSFTSLYNQSDVSFDGVSGYQAIQFSGFFEITEVPEPSTWFAAALALGAIGFSQRKRLRACASSAVEKHSNF